MKTLANSRSGRSASRVYAALVHYPVYDRDGGVAATSVTNIDIHDLSRSARTYGLAGLFMVTPITAQQELVSHVLTHWAFGGAGAARNPDRAEALGGCQVCPSTEAAVLRISQLENAPPRLWATAARTPQGTPAMSFPAAKRELQTACTPTLLLFGTGHGLHSQLLVRADAILAPIDAGGDYNHLSVRAAFAIVLDRLFA